jgi:type IV secretion system protein VirD4
MSNPFSRRAQLPGPLSDRQELLLGWSGSTPPQPFGIAPRPVTSQGDWEPLTYGGDAPVLTCASTGSGKTRGVLIPNLLRYPGPVIVVDIKGELFQVTSRRRREMGQQVVVLDPFQLVTTRRDGLNPLDLLTLPRGDVDSDAEMLASLLAVGHEFAREPFWNTMATGLSSGVIAHIANGPPAERHLGGVREWLFHPDIDYAIASALDKKAVKSRVAREQFIAYLGAPHEQTRPSIRTTACSYVSALGSRQVMECLETSTFRLRDVYDGKPLSIYIVIPPEKLDSHKVLLRLWVGTLLTAVMRRTVMPSRRTLFLLDECAQLGSLNVLRQAITLLRGSGLQTFTFWQDLSQLRACYPKDWESILNNSAAMQVFGITNHNMAKEWAELMGMRAQDLNRLALEDAAVSVRGKGSVVCRRPDYLTDEMFAGLFDANQRFALQGQPRM